MFRYVGLWLGLLTRCLQHQTLLLENLVLRQQLAVLKRKHPKPRMEAVDKIFWVFARRFWGAWIYSRAKRGQGVAEHWMPASSATIFPPLITMRVFGSTRPFPSSILVAAITMRLPCAGVCEVTCRAEAQTPIMLRMQGMILMDRMTLLPVVPFPYFAPLDPLKNRGCSEMVWPMS